MHLLYLWIKNQRDFICEQDINFGGKFIFHYDEKLKKLNIEENSSYIKNFFSTENSDKKSVVTNISAIIGTNGSGKTTILEFIMENLIWGMGGIQKEAIIALKDENDEYIIYCHENIEIIETDNLDAYNIELKKYKIHEKVFNYPGSTETKMITHSDIEESYNTSAIFFSNGFDNQKRLRENFGKLINISTNFLIKNDKTKMIENKRANKDASEVELHKIQETHRQIRFWKSFAFNKNKLPFLLPEKIMIKPFFDIQFDKNNDYYSLIENIKKASSVYRNNQTNFAEILKSRILEAIICNFFSELTSYKKLFEIKEETIGILKQQNSIDEKIMNFFERLSFQVHKESEDIINWINAINNFIRTINNSGSTSKCTLDS